MPPSKTQALPDTRIQARNRQVIFDAALEVFSDAGFKGATIDRIAALSGMSKPNLLYYFRSKEDIYMALLEHTLSDWLEPLRSLDDQGDPIAELTRYIQAKIRMSFANPRASRLFANEILHGAPMVGKVLQGPLRALVDEKAAIISGWVEASRIREVDPHHLIFAIWAVTQHYADFSVQVSAVLGRDEPEAAVERAVLDILLRGLIPPASEDS
jgi:TetR/AcrR family transcriptional regulator